MIGLNPFQGVLVDFPDSSVKSIPLEIFKNDDSEYNGAVLSEEFKQNVYLFSKGQQQVIRARFKVPSDYTNGKISLSLVCYSPSVANNFQLSLKSILSRQGTDAVGTEALSNTYNSGVIANTALVNKLKQISIDINDGVYKIGGQLVTADSLIDLMLMRDTLVSNDDDADIRVIPNFEVIKN
jgi:hypothetical protein